MITIINGSIATGKTTTASELNERWEQSVMLDGDYLGAVNPFEIYDKRRIEYLYETMAHLIAFHLKHGYEHFIINYVFESNEELDLLVDKLETLEQTIRCFWLVCSEEKQEERIIKRNTNQVEWELVRAKELNKILFQADKNGFIGKQIQSDGTVKEVAELITRLIRN